MLSIANAPANELQPFEQFTVQLRLDTQGARVRGGWFAFTAEPAGSLNIRDIQIVPATSISRTDGAFSRRALFTTTGPGALIGSNILVANIDMEVLQFPTEANVEIRVNALGLMDNGGNELDPAVSFASVQVAVPDPPPPPAPTPDPTPVGDGIIFEDQTSEAALTHGKAKGCGMIPGTSRAERAVILFALFFMIHLFIIWRRRYVKQAQCQVMEKGTAYRRRLPMILLAVAVSMLVLPEVSRARIYHVDTAGCSGQACECTAAQPCNSLEEAISKGPFVPGDTIQIHSGTYNETAVAEVKPTTTGSGVFGLPIVIRGTSRDNVVINSGTGASAHAAIGMQDFASYIIIENIHFQNGGRWDQGGSRGLTDPHIIAGARVGPGVIVRNNRFSGALYGRTSSDNKTVITLLGNELLDPDELLEGLQVAHNEMANINFEGDDSRQGFSYISVGNSAYCHVLNNEIIHSNPNNGPRNHIEVDGDQDRGVGGGCIVERNFTAGAFFAASSLRGNIVVRAMQGLGGPATVRNNVIYMQLEGAATSTDPLFRWHAAAITLTAFPHQNNRIHHNTIHMDKSRWSPGSDPDAVPDNMRFEAIFRERSTSSSQRANSANNVFTGIDDETHTGKIFVVGGHARDTDPGPPNPGRLTDFDGNMFFGLLNHDLLDGPNPDVDCDDEFPFDEGLPICEFRREINFRASNIEPVAHPLGAHPASPFNVSEYIDQAAPNGGSSETWCTDMRGNLTGCDNNLGAQGGPLPYGTTDTFTFCGDRDNNRLYDLRDVLQLEQDGNGALARDVATYMVSMNRADLPSMTNQGVCN